ncbi:MAG: MG2 domain-containing protein [Lautropia sp.]|nr:MG2 domain-containing protein [Lautropia sp.]
MKAAIPFQPPRPTRSDRPSRPGTLSLALGLMGVAFTPSLQALGIEQVSPQGTVGPMQQVVIRFDQAAIRLGDPSAPAPFRIRCDPAGHRHGTGHWTNEREWVYDFDRRLPSGVRCQLDPDPAFRSPDGQPLKVTGTYHFNTGGPRVSFIRPYEGMSIEEEQAFAVQLSSPATLKSLNAHLWCHSADLGERIPVRLLTGDQRLAVLKAAGLGPRDPATSPSAPSASSSAPADSDDQLALQCQRRLTPGTKLTLAVDPGLRAPNGLAQTEGQHFRYLVREPFRAEMSCERENAQSACLPIRPITLSFNAPITIRAARAIRLYQGERALTPRIEGDPAPRQDQPTGQEKSREGTSRNNGTTPPSSTSPSAPQAAGSDEPLVDFVRFEPFFDENARYELRLPADLHDASGRPLINADSFPLTVRTGPMPPLARFAAAPFGIIERHANGPGEPALLPVTLRRVESRLGARQLQFTRLDARHSDREIIEWMRKVEHYDSGHVGLKQAAADIDGPLPMPRNEAGEPEDMLDVRALSLLVRQPGVQTMTLPASTAGDSRPFEVVGIPLDTGFHVLEIASPRLGQALLGEAYGPDRSFHVRTTALVTNLGVHFKQGRENALAWVTTLDTGKPVAGARVRLSTCQGEPVAEGVTDAQGVARFGALPHAPYCGRHASEHGNGYFVSARTGEADKADMAFIWSGWQRGIEPWRFEVPTSQDSKPDITAHTVFDRTLLRAGETVSMKHFVRQESSPATGNLTLPTTDTDTLVITHVGSGQQYVQPLSWQRTASGGRSADNRFTLPPGAKLGQYQVTLKNSALELDSGSFRVEAFRLPVYQGQLQIGETAALVAPPPGRKTAPADARPNVAPTSTEQVDTGPGDGHTTGKTGATPHQPLSVPLSLNLNYVSGGPAAGLATRVSVQMQARTPEFPDYPGFRFEAPRRIREEDGSLQQGGTDEIPDPDEAPEAMADASPDSRLILDKQTLQLDGQGQGQLMLAIPGQLQQPVMLMAEADYADPSGEIHTLQGRRTVWPARVVAGIKAEHWVSVDQGLSLQALALDLNGRPLPGARLSVQATARTTTTSRKRMVGGFYSYDHQTHTRSLGTVCEGRSDTQGRMDCTVSLTSPGEVELIVSAEDEEGRRSLAAQSVWVTGQGELWFDAENHDRMAVIAEKKHYEPGETARFQIRMPFREATALVAIEREGIIETRVMPLAGSNPTIELKVADDWSPNVYVSVLALRGRLREVPWYNPLRWGPDALTRWWQSWTGDRQAGSQQPAAVPAPTALVDLAKPAFRFGMAEIRVGLSAHRLGISLQTDRKQYPVRGKARVRIEARLPDGKPAAHAEVAVAAVDQALLELMPNRSWQLLESMLTRRSWGVSTATAQMEVVGRRHYGRKAVPAGGDGGQGMPTRELFDTLLYWNPRIALDAQGHATIDVPLNDAISQFRIVALADHGSQFFGTGQTSIDTSQDLQIISGLPPLVRGGDRFQAMLSLRNRTDAPMQLTVSARAGNQTLPSRQLSLPAGASVPLTWEVAVPDTQGDRHQDSLRWEIEARDERRGIADRLALSQQVLPAVPTTVQQATLLQLDSPYRTPVSTPAGALPSRGGLRIGLQPRLVDGLPAVQDWFRRYPYTCLEQQGSKALVLGERKRWQALMAQLPAYLDDDGLAAYFPPVDGRGDAGSDVLSSWLLAASDEASKLDPAFALPDESRQVLIRGLTRFVEGRLSRRYWSPRADLTVRKLMAIEALSRHGAASASMVSNLEITPRQWPTSALIDWLNILKRMPALPRHAHLKREALQLLRARLSYQGSRIVLQHEDQDAWWWLMVNGDVNAARLLLTVLDEPGWRAELGRLATGLIGRQEAGTWQTTTANLWGWLALSRFSRAHESAPVEGVTQAVLRTPQGEHQASFDWGRTTEPLFFDWPDTAAATLSLRHQGQGKPWASIQSLAAVPRTEAFSAGYRIEKQITPIQQLDPTLPAGHYSRGDILRVRLTVQASAPMTWVVFSDPVPAGATILGSGLGRDSALASGDESTGGVGWLAYEERGHDAFRRYFEWLPAGESHVEYTIRLNQTGRFLLPPSRVEALYAPDRFGESPNAPVMVVSPAEAG